MSWSTPPTWAHGDTVAHTDMQIYSDDENAIYAKMGSVLLNFPSANAIPGEDNDLAYMVHRYRWFWFKSNGTLVDPANSANTVTLTEDTEPTMLDLNSVSWLYPGKLYQITGVTWSMETRAIASVFDSWLRLEDGSFWLLEDGSRILTERG
jgi:hypothetical protein